RIRLGVQQGSADPLSQIDAQCAVEGGAGVLVDRDPDQVASSRGYEGLPLGCSAGTEVESVLIDIEHVEIQGKKIAHLEECGRRGRDVDTHHAAALIDGAVA